MTDADFFSSRLSANPDLRLGDVTTTNWTMTEVKCLGLSALLMICLLNPP